MDGTLLDSEHLTDAAVAHLLKVHDLDLEVDSTAFHGRTWSLAAETLQKLAPSLRTVDVAAELQSEVHRALVETVAPGIAGAPEPVMATAVPIEEGMGGLAVSNMAGLPQPPEDLFSYALQLLVSLLL